MEYAEDDQYTGQHINRNSRNNVIVFHKNGFGDKLERPRLKVDISAVLLSDINHVGNELESSKIVNVFMCGGPDRRLREVSLVRPIFIQLAINANVTLSTRMKHPIELGALWDGCVTCRT